MYYLLYYNIYPKLQRICIISFPVLCLLMLYLLYHFLWNKYVIASSFFIVNVKKNKKHLHALHFLQLRVWCWLVCPPQKVCLQARRWQRWWWRCKPLCCCSLVRKHFTLTSIPVLCSVNRIYRSDSVEKQQVSAAHCSQRERERESILLLLFHSVMLMLNS